MEWTAARPFPDAPALRPAARHTERGVPLAALLVAYAVLSLVTLAPLFLVEIPGFGDYLNHLARVHVTASYDGSPALQAVYTFKPGLRPYHALETIVPALMKVMPIYTAGRVHIGIVMLLPVAGVAALHWAVWRRASATPLLAFVFVQNKVLSWGFLNYQFGVGIALLLLAGWLLAEHWPRWRRAWVFAIAATVLYGCHLLAFAAYCFAIAGIEIARAWRLRPGWREVLAEWTAASAQALPGALMLTHLDIAGMTVAPALTAYGTFASRIDALLSPLLFLEGRVDQAQQILLPLLAAYLLLRHRVAAAQALWPSAALLWLLAVAVPEWIDGTWGMHLRFPLLAAFVLVAAIELRPTRREGIVLAAVVGTLIAGESADAARTLMRQDPHFAEMRKVVQAIPPGAKVIVAAARPPEARNRQGPWRLTAQASALAVIERDVFVPFLFTGVPRLSPQPGLVPLSTPHGHPISREELEDGLGVKDDAGLPEGDGEGRRVYWRNWPAHFDYVIWQDFGAPGLGHPDLLEQVAKGRDITVYRIRRP